MSVPSSINGKSIGVTVVGGIFLWSGIKGVKISTTIRDLLTGKNPTLDASSSQLDPTLAEGSVTGAASSVDTILQDAPTGPGGSPATNKSIARLLAAPLGWSSGAQWEALVMLWTRESGWSNTAENASSGAYGIPQALPPTKMPKAAQPPKYGGASSARSQIAWGLRYIQQRYGNPVAAWAHETQFGWY